MSCVFCDRLSSGEGRQLGSVVALRDNYPVTPGHTLIVPVRCVPAAFDLTSREIGDLLELARVVRDDIEAEDPEVSGFNLGWNCGEAAGQTVFHAHFHVIPRRFGDHTSPRGGIRGVIPDKQSY